MKHPPPPVNQPQLPFYPPPASSPVQVKDAKGRGVGKKSKSSTRLEEGPPISLPISIPLSGPGVASTSHAQDQEEIYPGQGSGHVSPERRQEGVDPEDPLDEQQEEHDSDSSEVNPRRFGRRSESQIDDLISRRIQAAFARSDRRNDAYIQEVRGQMLLQDQRMASLEIQSNLNAGECQFFIVDFKYFSPMYYMIIYNLLIYLIILGSCWSFLI